MATQEQIYGMMDALLDVEEGMREKDVNFVNDIGVLRDKFAGWMPTGPQLKYIENLYEKHC